MCPGKPLQNKPETPDTPRTPEIQQGWPDISKPDLAALAHPDLPGVSPELTARLSAESLKDIAAAVLWWRVSITEPGGRVVGVDTPSGWTLADWQAYAERYHGPGCSVTPIAGIPKPRAPVNLNEALASTGPGVAGT